MWWARRGLRSACVGRAEAIAKYTALGEHYKVHLIERRPPGETLTFYTHGRDESAWTDFCAGPHVPRTGLLKAVKLRSVAGAYWLGDEKNKQLQRIYGTVFATPAELDEFLRLEEEAKKRDHRKLGKELSISSCSMSTRRRCRSFCPAAYAALQQARRVRPEPLRPSRATTRSSPRRSSTERLFEDERPLTPTTARGCTSPVDGRRCSTRSWGSDAKASVADPTTQARQAFHGARLGELEAARPEADELPGPLPDVRPPKRRSYRELPMRLADFGRLHRYERGGVVHGLARVRSFSQDDAHIFCAPASVEAEMAAFLTTFYADLRGCSEFTSVST